MLLEDTLKEKLDKYRRQKGKKWDQGDMDSEDLNHLLRQYTSLDRETLRARYSDNADPGLPVAQALVMGYISRKDIPAKVFKEIEVLADLLDI